MLKFWNGRLASMRKEAKRRQERIATVIKSAEDAPSVTAGSVTAECIPTGSILDSHIVCDASSHIVADAITTGSIDPTTRDFAYPVKGLECNYGNTPDAVLMPRRLTAENGAKYALSGEFRIDLGEEECSECEGGGIVACPHAEGESQCDNCDGRGYFDRSTLVPWDTIKEIYAAAVKHFHPDA